MATYTEHYNLIKPALNDKVNINNLNDNADIIDAALYNKVNTDDTQNIITSANNCMMSDGVTSVEDALDGLTDYVIDTTTISGVKITKMGHLVMLSIDKTITMSGSQWITVGTVPYKPTTEIFGVAKQDAVDKIISIDLPTNGKLAVMGSGSDAILVRGSLTYLTND